MRIEYVTTRAMFTANEHWFQASVLVVIPDGARAEEWKLISTCAFQNWIFWTWERKT